MSDQTDTMKVGAEGALPPQVAALPASDSSGVEGDQLDQIKSLHRRFKIVGSRAQPDRSVDGLVPVHLYPLIRFGSVRVDYPIVIPSGHGRPIPLTSVIDRAIDELDVDEDERARARTAALRLEAEIRHLVDSDGAADFDAAWTSAADRFSTQLDEGRREVDLRRLSAVRAKIEVAGMVFPFGRDSAAEMFRRASIDRAETQVGRLNREMDPLRAGLRAMLELDDSESDEAHSPDNLAASVGGVFGGDLDFEALSELMDQGPHGPSLDAGRRARMEKTLATLSEYAAAFAKTASGNPSVKVISKADDLLHQGDEHRDRCLSLVKAVQIARLELANEYRDDLHGAQFDALTSDRLAAADLTFMPIDPVVVPGRLMESAEPVLEDILDGDVPVKVLVLIESLDGESGRPTSGTPLGLRLLAGGRPSAAIFQAVLSDLEASIDSLERAMAFPGPAVVCLFVGSEFGPDNLHPYLASAAAGDARAVPYFANDPSGGVTLADRFSVDRNLDHTSPWPVSDVRYRDAEGDEVVEPRPFMAGDLLSMSGAAGDDFLRIGTDEWHEDLIPLDQYLELESRDAKIPFILMVSETGELYRAACTERIVQATERVAQRWRALQELAGIENSHANRLVASERERIEQVAQLRIEELEAEFRKELDQKTGILAEQIVANIASGLLGSDLTAGPVPAIQPDAAEQMPRPELPDDGSVPIDVEDASTPTDETGPSELADTGGDDDDEISFDEAYIETPRCTTCDECTTINPRMFAYNADKQAYIADITAGTFRELVLAAEKCPVKIIHPGKPINDDEPHLDELVARAEAFQ